MEAKKRPQMREQCPGAKQPGHPRVALRDLTQKRKAKGERTLPPQPLGDRLTTQKTDYTNGLKWPAILTTKG